MHAPPSASFPALIPRLARAGELAFGAVAAIAATALWGWALDVRALRDFGAAFPPMPPAGALAYLLLACSFFAAAPSEEGAAPRARRAARMAAFLAGGIAVLALVED